MQKNIKNSNLHNHGFTLIELLITVGIISILSVSSLFGIAKLYPKTRDTVRMKDMATIQAALEQYYAEHGKYPDETYGPGGSLAGWEVSYKDPFLEDLNPYLRGGSVPVDPMNIGVEPFANGAMFVPRPDGNFFYMYYYYDWVETPGGRSNPGTFYGCNFKGPLAVIGFRAAENSNTKLPEAAWCDNRPNPDPSTCPTGGIQNVCRYWGTEFDYAVMMRG